MATPSSLPSATPCNSSEYDIIPVLHLVGIAAFTFVEFYTRLLSSSEAPNASVISITRWVNDWGVPHRFLILHVKDSTGDRDLYFRLDRRKGNQQAFISSSSPSLALDEVLASCQIERILSRKATKEAELKLGTPVPLVRVGLLLQAVIDICPEYRSLTQEDCWFIASVVQEVFCNKFGGTYQMGKLTHSKRKKTTRVRIYQRLAELELV